MITKFLGEINHLEIFLIQMISKQIKISFTRKNSYFMVHTVFQDYWTLMRDFWEIPVTFAFIKSQLFTFVKGFSWIYFLSYRFRLIRFLPLVFWLWEEQSVSVARWIGQHLPHLYSCFWIDHLSWKFLDINQRLIQSKALSLKKKKILIQELVVLKF